MYIYIYYIHAGCFRFSYFLRCSCSCGCSCNCNCNCSCALTYSRLTILRNSCAPYFLHLFEFICPSLTLDTNCFPFGSNSSSCPCCIVCCTILMYVRTFIPLVFLSSLGRLACLNFLSFSFSTTRLAGWVVQMF